MDCQAAIEAIARVGTGTLPPAERRALDGHATSCVRCRAEMGLASAIDAALGAAVEPFPSAGFSARVLARLRSSAESRLAPVRVPMRSPQYAPAWPLRFLVRAAPVVAIAATIGGMAIIGPHAGGTALIDFFTRPLPELAPATWVSVIAGAGLAVAGVHQATSFFAER